MVLIQEKDSEINQVKNIESKKTNQPITFALTDDDADNAELKTRKTNSGFGIGFPENPQKGDLFLRVDTLPNKLYKWNGKKWIEIDKTMNDRYAHDEEYIKYLLEKVRNREISIDDLTRLEQDQILKNLSYIEKGRLL